MPDIAKPIGFGSIGDSERLVHEDYDAYQARLTVQKLASCVNLLLVAEAEGDAVKRANLVLASGSRLGLGNTLGEVIVSIGKFLEADTPPIVQGVRNKLEALGLAEKVLV